MGYVGFAFPRYVIGPGNSHRPLNQSDAKQKIKHDDLVTRVFPRFK